MSASETGEQPGRVALLVAAGAGALMLVSALLSAVTGHRAPPIFGTQPENATASSQAPQDSYVTGMDATFRTTGPARVRDRPTADGSQVLETLSAGTTLTGREVWSTSGTTKWLRVERNSRVAYVWTGNLAAN